MNLNSIRTYFSRGIYIWSQKFEILSLAQDMTIFMFKPHFRKLQPSPIRVIYISSAPEFWGDPGSEVWNSISGSCYSYICAFATLRENLTFTNQDDPYIILTQFSRRIQIWSQKFQILSVAFIFCKLLF
jgi:hypothetical protein